MDSYSRANKWKIVLAFVSLIFLIVPWLYTNYLATKLKKEEITRVELFAKAMNEINTNPDLDADFTFHNDVIKILDDIPIVAIDEKGNIIESQNFPEIIDTAKVINELKTSGIPPIEGFGYGRYIYYKHPFILTLLNYFPWIQFMLLLTYILIAYAVFNSSRREEQNRVWVGMAKETAHQLGTPISGIIGWMENLKLMTEKENEAQHEILFEMERDVQKLQQVSDRFSKIGSKPDLQRKSLIDELLICKNYIAARASKEVKFDLQDNQQGQFYSAINSNLFQWVIENLLRNSLDAMDGQGTITLRVLQDELKKNKIIISDTGKGIPPSKINTIFKPGYTTKTRGWGLGLSLSKRIIENYHNGKIYVSHSELNKGTSFTIELPVV